MMGYQPMKGFSRPRDPYLGHALTSPFGLQNLSKLARLVPRIRVRFVRTTNQKGESDGKDVQVMVQPVELVALVRFWKHWIKQLGIQTCFGWFTFLSIFRHRWLFLGYCITHIRSIFWNVIFNIHCIYTWRSFLVYSSL